MPLGPKTTMATGAVTGITWVEVAMATTWEVEAEATATTWEAEAMGTTWEGVAVEVTETIWEEVVEAGEVTRAVVRTPGGAAATR